MRQSITCSDKHDSHRKETNRHPDGGQAPWTSLVSLLPAIQCVSRGTAHAGPVLSLGGET